MMAKKPYAGIAPAAFARVVRVIYGYGRPVTREEIIEIAEVDAVTVERILARFIERGLILGCLMSSRK